MSETNRRYQSSIEHDDKVIEHARLIDMGWSQAQADEKVWGYVPPEIKAEREAKKRAEQARSASYALTVNHLDYNEITRDEYGMREDRIAEQRRKDMEF
tara:strand:+ start:801 stop:1097 length:297 start_codon:yes stop_codon:yes gene_type:complete